MHVTQFDRARLDLPITRKNLITLVLTICHDSGDSILMTRHYPDLGSAGVLIGWKSASTNEKTDTTFIAPLRMYFWRSKTTLDTHTL